MPKVNELDLPGSGQDWGYESCVSIWEGSAKKKERVGTGNGSRQAFWACSVKRLKRNTIFKLRSCIVILFHVIFSFLSTKEMSHRTSDFTKILNTAENLMRELL